MADQIADFDYNDAAITTRPVQASITGITAANPAVITAANTYAAGDKITITGVAGMTEINGRWVTIDSRTATTITTDLDTSSGFTAYSGAAGTCTLVHGTTNAVRITWDDTQNQTELVDAMQRAKEYLARTL